MNYHHNSVLRQIENQSIEHVFFDCPGNNVHAILASKELSSVLALHVPH